MPERKKLMKQGQETKLEKAVSALAVAVADGHDL